jgi:hypothetical protein
MTLRPDEQTIYQGILQRNRELLPEMPPSPTRERLEQIGHEARQQLNNG